MIHSINFNKIVFALGLVSCLLLPSITLGKAPASTSTKDPITKTKPQPTKSVDNAKGNFVILVGTICSNSRKLNLAIIEDNKSKKQSVFRTGAALPNGAMIKDIFPDHILIEKDKKSKIVKISGGSDKNQDTSKFNTQNLKIKGYQKIADNQYIVNPYKLFNSFSDLVKLCANLKIKKVPEGFLLESIEDNDLIKALGFKEGDIITKANNNKFDSLYAALEYLWSVESDAVLNVEVARNDNTSNIEIYPSYDQLPSCISSGKVTYQRVSSMLAAKHKYTMTNIVYK